MALNRILSHIIAYFRILSDIIGYQELVYVIGLVYELEKQHEKRPEKRGYGKSSHNQKILYLREIARNQKRINLVGGHRTCRVAKVPDGFLDAKS